MTSPTTNTVTDDAVEAAARIIWAGLTNNTDWDRMVKLELTSVLAHARGIVRAALTAALSTHPHTGTEDRATARVDCNHVYPGLYADLGPDTRCIGCGKPSGLSPAQRTVIPHTGGREAVIEECAAIFDIRAKAHKEAWNTCASDGHGNAAHWRDRMYEALSAAASIRALSLSPPLQKTQKETT